MKRQIWFVMVGVVLVLGIAVIMMKSGTKPSSIPIGVVGPLTGDGATYGQSMRRGYDLAFKGDSQMRLIYEDDKLSPKDGVSAINKLISADHVKVVLGSAASGVTLAMAPIANRSKVILFSSISTSDDLRKSGEYVFRNVPRNEIQGITAARFLHNKLGKKKIAVLKKNDEYATNLSRSFVNELVRLGGTVVYEDAYQPGTVDFRSVIEQIRKIGPDALYVPGNYQETGLFLKQAFENALNLLVVGGDGSYSPELIKIAGNAAEGSYYTIMAVQSDSDYYRSFEKAFTSEYGKAPDVYDAYAFEAASIVRDAIKKVGHDSTKIRDYLLSQTFDSMTGLLKFDADGEVQREYGIVRVVNGSFVDQR